MTSTSTSISTKANSAAVVMVLAKLWSTQGDQFANTLEAINKILMIFAPAVTAVLVLGVFWRRGTNEAALATFAVGCLVGLVYFIVDMKVVGIWILDSPPAGFLGFCWPSASSRSSGYPWPLLPRLPSGWRMPVGVAR